MTNREVWKDALGLFALIIINAIVLAAAGIAEQERLERLGEQ